jgi:hypothetical protein
MGRLIPAGTGLEYYRNVEVEAVFEEPKEEEPLALDAVIEKEAPRGLMEKELTT